MASSNKLIYPPSKGIIFPFYIYVLIYIVPRAIYNFNKSIMCLVLLNGLLHNIN